MEISNKKKIIKNIIIVTLPLLFFFIMIFVTYSVSDNMYNNVTLKLLHSKTKMLRNIISLHKDDYTYISDSLDFPIVYLNVYSDVKDKLFLYGENKYFISNKIKSNKNKSNKNKLIQISENNNLYYFDYFEIKNKTPIYCDIVYNFTAMKMSLFENGKMILLFIFIFTLTIIYFLFILIFAYQKRINATKKTIQEITNIDVTTGFFLSQHFFELLDKEVERFFRTNNEFTLLICEIDKFHGIGRLYSDEFGEQILYKISTIIKDNFRNFDIIGRTGENEISIIMVNSNANEGYKAANRCNDHIKENKFYFEKLEITFSLKVGIASSNIYEEYSNQSSISENNNPNAKVSTKEQTREIVLKALEALNKAKMLNKGVIQIYKKS